MGRRIALLVGNQTFLKESGLQPLRGPVNDVEAFASVLEKPTLGNFEVRKCLGGLSHEVTRAIVETLQSAARDDFVLIFYSGHGKTSVGGRLFLATADTTETALQATAVSTWSLHDAVTESLCKEVVLLLDCCYSGAVSQGLRAGVEGQLQAVQNAAGFFILTASTAIQTASETETEHDGKVMGRFTAAIVDGIQSSGADLGRTGEIRLSDLKAYVERTLRGQTPQFFAHAGSGDPLISYGARPLLDQSALTDLDDDSWYRRLGAVKYLTGILLTGRSREIQAARARLVARRGLERDVDVSKAIDDALSLKDVNSSTATRDKMLLGVNTVANAVKATLGPKGRRVMIGKPPATPRWTKSGVCVAEKIELSDSYENLGAQLIRDVALKTYANARDGTTTAVVLARSIIVEGLKSVEDGVNPMDLKRGIDQAVVRVVQELKTISKKVLTKAEITRVGAISANGDKRVGDLIAMAIDRVGSEGAILIEESENSETEIDVVPGVRFDRGYLSPYFITNAEKVVAEFEDAYILIHEKKIFSLQPLLPVLEAVVQTGKPLVIIAEDVEGEALSTLVVNKLRGGLKVAAVKAPGFGDRRKAMLEDIAILTEGQMISADLGIKLENVTLQMLGRAKRVRIEKEHTTIVTGRVAKNGIEGRATQIKAQIEETTSDYDKEKLQERLAKAGGVVAVIRVGGKTEVEVKEMRDQFDDALNVTRAAVEEGIVPGGGVALLRASRTLEGFECDNDDQDAGVTIVRHALQAPLRQIAENAGLKGSVVVEKTLQSDSPTFGFDAQTKEYVDLMQSGIIDPTKVVRTALQEAASTAGLFITTESAILEAPSNDGGKPVGSGQDDKSV